MQFSTKRSCCSICLSTSNKEDAVLTLGLSMHLKHTPTVPTGPSLSKQSCIYKRQVPHFILIFVFNREIKLLPCAAPFSHKSTHFTLNTFLISLRRCFFIILIGDRVKELEIKKSPPLAGVERSIAYLCPRQPLNLPNAFNWKEPVCEHDATQCFSEFCFRGVLLHDIVGDTFMMDVVSTMAPVLTEEGLG